MIQPKTKLEKFLISAIRNASEEFQEELDILKESSAPPQSLSVLEKIISDLFNSTEMPVLYFDSVSPFAEKQAEIEEEIAERGISLKYDIGDEVLFQGTLYTSDYQVKSFRKRFGISEDEYIGNSVLSIYNQSVRVIGRTPPLFASCNLYVIEHEGIWYFVSEYDLHNS